MKPKVLIIFGTRPEAIKMAPVVKALSGEDFEVRVCVFRQHREVLDQMLAAFVIVPDYDLPVSLSDKDVFGSGVPFYKKGFNLAKSGMGLLRFLLLLRKMKPDMVLVQGDTSTAMLAALFASNLRISVGHVEAGLRTHNKYSPFPEEINRRVISAVADLHFAPTPSARDNLLRENIPRERVYVTGNTEIDATLFMLKKQPAELLHWHNLLIRKYGLNLDPEKRLILVTAHRRESFGEGIENICAALLSIAESRPDVQIVYPVHPNPNVRNSVLPRLSGRKNITLLPPMDYGSFLFLVSRAYMIMTDSGGIQEATSVMGKPVLVMRDVTERPEAIKGGNAKLVGVSREKIVAEAIRLLDDKRQYAKMAKSHTSFGDGGAAEKIAAALKKFFKTRPNQTNNRTIEKA